MIDRSTCLYFDIHKERERERGRALSIRKVMEMIFRNDAQKVITRYKRRSTDISLKIERERQLVRKRNVHLE